MIKNINEEFFIKVNTNNTSFNTPPVVDVILTGNTTISLTCTEVLLPDTAILSNGIVRTCTFLESITDNTIKVQNNTLKIGDVVINSGLYYHIKDVNVYTNYTVLTINSTKSVFSTSGTGSVFTAVTNTGIYKTSAILRENGIYKIAVQGTNYSNNVLVLQSTINDSTNDILNISTAVDDLNNIAF